MDCKTNFPKPPILFKLSTKTPYSSSSFSLQPTHKAHSPTLSLSQNQNQQRSVTETTHETQLHSAGLCNINFQTKRSCKLGISRYPDFKYDAEGGTGTATGKTNIDGISMSFDIGTLCIPPLTSATTRFLGLPLPPFLKIEIVPEIFQGTINEETGKVELDFRAKFWFSVGSVYRAPPLIVETLLTTEEARGAVRAGRGERLNEDGDCRLVGVATVHPIPDLLMNAFLGLPTECLADLNANILVSSFISN